MFPNVLAPGQQLVITSTFSEEAGVNANNSGKYSRGGGENRGQRTE
jgi:hypothetical protein